MKTIVLNRKFYAKPSTRADGMFDVWKNNGADAPDQLVAGPFASKIAALEKADELEAKTKAAAQDNRSMNNATDILLGYLADNPEIAKCLLDKAIKHAAAKERARAAQERAAELVAAAMAIDDEIAKAQSEINRLKGRVLSLQKSRKAIKNEAIALSKEFGVQRAGFRFAVK